MNTLAAATASTIVEQTATATAQRLRSVLSDFDPSMSSADGLAKLVALGLDKLPMPGSGATLQRWRALAAVAEHDLSLAKLYEGHTDALAILDELGAASNVPANATWGVWAAEAPQGRAVIESHDGEAAVLTGAKCWCSGAASVSHALLTAWHADDGADNASTADRSAPTRQPQLVRIELRQPGVRVDSQAWQAVGMSQSKSLDVDFRRAHGKLVGRPGDYLSRPGFWQGGAGIAACWYGGASGIAAALRRSTLRQSPAHRNPFAMAAMGKVDLYLASTAAMLRDAATWTDVHPTSDARAVALRVRLAAEDCATRVLGEVGRAMGAGPFCRDAKFARAAADLPVFIRQSHAERDYAALGERALTPESESWDL
jgi:hypothetical protein